MGQRRQSNKTQLDIPALWVKSPINGFKETEKPQHKWKGPAGTNKGTKDVKQ